MEIDNTLQARWGFLPKSEATENKAEDPEKDGDFDSGEIRATQTLHRSSYSITALETSYLSPMVNLAQYMPQQLF